MNKFCPTKILIALAAGLMAIPVLADDVAVRSSNGKTPAFELFDPGSEAVVDYEKYGYFENLGLPGYRYIVTDAMGLASAVGEGIYPNTKSIRQDPDFQKYLYNKRLEGDHWDVLHDPDVRRSFFKWAIATPEDPGIKLFFTGFSLERAGLYQHAVKAYHACLVQFPKSHGLTFWNAPWYVGPTALDRLEFLLKAHPELNLRLEGAEVVVENGFNVSAQDDQFTINPGRLVPGVMTTAIEDISTLQRKVMFSGEHIKLVQFENGHWQMLVDGKPYVIRGMSYQPSPIGTSPDNGSLKPTEDWMTADRNDNGKPDGPYDSWVDKNRNNRQDRNEPTVGDFALMRDMGVNTLRIYHHSFNRKLLDDLYETYGIRVLMGDLLGAYTVGSEALWYHGTDYTDEGQLRRMRASVQKMVMEYKDHPGVLMWVLGNENVYGANTNAPRKHAQFFAFANSVAQWIKSVDPNHPVVISNGDILHLDSFAKNAPDIDVFGCNAYRGNHGFGQSLWSFVKRACDKPVLITEFGCPAFHKGKTAEQAEGLQAQYIKQNWLDIKENTAGKGHGNALGGVIFEWLDEWWKAGPPPQYNPSAHDTVGQWQGPFLDGWMYEEWLGVASQGDGKNSPFLRQLRKIYYTMKAIWQPVQESRIGAAGKR